jgi:hypothetical protein
LKKKSWKNKVMSSLKDKIYNYEVTPPAGTWDKIAIDLDEAELANKFPDRLYSMEATPPSHSWEKVNAALNPGNEPVIPIFKRIRPFVRYAAAAIFIGGLALGIIKLTTGSDNTLNTTAQSAGNKDSSESGKTKPGVADEIQAAKSVTDDDDAALEQSKKMLAKLDPPLKTLAPKLRAGNSHVRYADDQDTELTQSIYAYEDHVPNLADRYVMLMTPDGNIIRMAKKWSELLCCVSGEEQDADCKDQLKKWQQKMATSSLAPSPGNFMDILGLVNSLNEGSEL